MAIGVIPTDTDLTTPSAEPPLWPWKTKNTSTRSRNVEHQLPVSVLMDATQDKNAAILGLSMTSSSGNHQKLSADSRGCLIASELLIHKRANSPTLIIDNLSNNIKKSKKKK